MAKPQVVLEFAGDEKKLSRTFDSVASKAKQLEQKVGRAGESMARESKKTSTFMSGVMKVAAGNMVASFSGAAFSAAGNLFGGMIEEAREAQKVSASTAQGIKTIGASAWTSAQQVGALAEKLSEKIGVDDEVIQQSANLLLTFANVKNAVGANNDIFNRAVAASQDLAAKGFGSADGAAKMLGKALNDPVKGITALSRAGVTFTQGQKDQIAAMVESGNILGAQKIIMGELEKQVGGTAAAMATGADKMAVRWGNFKEEMGTRLLPVIDQLIPVMSSLLDAIGPPMTEALRQIGIAIEANGPALTAMIGMLGEVITWAAQHPVVVAAILAITNVMGPLTSAINLLNTAMKANPIMLVVGLIAVLVGAFITLWNKSAAFRGFFVGLWNGIKSLVGTVVNWIKDRWNGLVSWFRGIPDAIGRALGSLGSIISGVFKSAINWVIDRLNDGIDLINGLIHGINDVTGVVGVPAIPDIPHIPRLHAGGVVPGAVGTEQLAILQAGERVTPRGSADTPTGGGRLVVVGDADGAVATMIRKLVRDGVLRLA